MDGQPALSFRLSFTPTTIPQIPPTWLTTAVAAGADIVLAQTIVFPPSTGYDYLRLARIVQQRLVQSLRLADLKSSYSAGRPSMLDALRGAGVLVELRGRPSFLCSRTILGGPVKA